MKKRLPIVLAALILGVLIIGICLVWYWPNLRETIEDWQEDWTYAHNPSAQLAFDYGERHFNEESNPQAYDIQRAEHFFDLAVQQDPHLPFIFHELARVAFIDGDFPLAMAYINVQIAEHGDASPNSYYVRGLIEGFMGDYPDAEADYKHFLDISAVNWAGFNDYAWVLLKDGKSQEAASVTTLALAYYPDNPWLLNSNATALYEIGDIAGAKAAILRASAAVASVTPQEWSVAYPGNNPDIAPEGVASFKAAVANNMHMILAATTSPSQ